jgi:steroid Delta-isomerase
MSDSNQMAADWFPFHEKSPSPEQIRATFRRYAAAITAHDLDGIVQQFAPDGTMDDPVGSPTIRGHAAIRKFFEAGYEASGGAMIFKLETAIRVAGRQAAAATLIQTPRYRVESVGVLTFDEKALITNVKAYYGSTNIFPS